ncbi:UDP-GlcNAc:betaGal beta-1,3-N-acetylglucosaminyltransferase 8 [Protobothrops mucrosquamatus]|uniref:UDP-GlcNAc:betaGal beta-1,3-N-acetylglucosaminyltransferase 8 n=1 Tax=Protobothrops mucrosquamatus TaxID=103944 RepID=UPI0010FB3F11|nr:UDP-GlcNAc:betaGal beta-1,3-N-acetylglucosaminyltransferase 8 [Protobothrops mucrosquamatus]
MNISRCLSIATALLTLVALKAYIEWTSEQEERYPTSSAARWHSSSITPMLPFENVSPAFVFQRFNVSLEQFRHSIPRGKAYWNDKQYKNFRALEEGSVANASWNKCPNGDMKELATKIKHFNSYPELYKNFVLYGDCRNYSFLINEPRKCAHTKNGTFLLLAIKSVPGNFAARQAVRDTWGQEGEPGGLAVRTVFLLGTAQGQFGPRLQHLVQFESRSFGDILMWDFEDTFFNLTLKDSLFLRWTLEYCRDVRFILKGDDDVFINTPKVLEYLSSVDANKPLYTGQVMSNASPFRDHRNKYYVPESFYVGPYPAYAGGGGYIISGPLARLLLLISQHVAFYPIDDVYTGFCFQALGIPPQPHAGFMTFDIAEKDRRDPCVHSQLLLVHRRSPQQTLHLWKQINNPDLQCGDEALNPQPAKPPGF